MIVDVAFFQKVVLLRFGARALKLLAPKKADDNYNDLFRGEWFEVPNMEVCARDRWPVAEERNMTHCFELGRAKIPFPQPDNKLVGRGEDLANLLYFLTGQPLECNVVALTGVSGVGKTALARSLYDHPLVVDHFDIRAWFCLSLGYHWIGQYDYDITDEWDRLDQLKKYRDHFFHRLKGKRYLIVLDDLWEPEDWDHFVKGLSHDDNGSRIILTSRNVDVCTYASPEIPPLSLNCLSPNESWELLESMIFPNDSCPQELIPLGRKIAHECQGLPVLINVIGSFLSMVEPASKFWEQVAYEVNNLPVIEELRICDILSVRNSFKIGSPKTSYTFERLKNEHLYTPFMSCLTSLVNQRMYKTAEMTVQDTTYKMNYLNKELKTIHGDAQFFDRAHKNVDVTSSAGHRLLAIVNPSSTSPKKDEKFVGLGEELETVLDFLTGAQKYLEVVVVTGMGGIGKTTFTKKLYDHPLVAHQFYVHAWVTVSQHYHLNKVLIGLLSCMINLSDEMYGWSHEQLQELLYRSLKGRRYLVVLDDVWEKKIWDDLRRFFPDDSNGSRIILTSRVRDVCINACRNIFQHLLRCLNPDESWELLCSKIFPSECCPSELVKIGKEIACKCQGLPLALVVVGGLLSRMNKMSTIWEEIKNCVSSLVMKDPQYCQNILALSYNHLPDELKACFLYMGIFPQGYDIHIQKLMHLWVAEGFIQSKEKMKLEGVAESYIEDLVARNLIMVKERRSNGRIKICCIHDILREFCLKEAQKENFLTLIDSDGHEPLVDVLGSRRVSFHSGIYKYLSLDDPISFTGSLSFFCFERLGPTDLKCCSGSYFKLLKILDIGHLHLVDLPTELLSLTRLRHLVLTIQNCIDVSALSKLQNLQNLLVRCEWDGHLPKEFWTMLELRHVNMKGNYAPSALKPKIFTDDDLLAILCDLQTLSNISPSSCTKEVFLSMPNLKKLGILEAEEDYQFHGWSRSLVYLQELETLKYVFSSPFVSKKANELHTLRGIFPPKLMKLTLSGTLLPWEDMVHLSKLPKLEVLKLKNYAFTGTIWEPTEDGFHCLKYLLIGSTDLKRWEAEKDHFPSLQHLVLRHCRSLEEIPSGIGDAPMLETIELHCCSDTAVNSARGLEEEQKGLGNDSLTVYITKSNSKFLRFSD